MDEQSQQFASQNSDQPLASLVEKEQAIEAKPETVAAPAPKDEPNSAASRIRAFEDENFGVEAVRVNGDIERGHGSPFSEMPDDKRRQYAALENLLKAEQRLADSTAALASAEAEHEAALALLAASETDASA